MYEVRLGENILYYPANADYAIYDTELNEEVGQAAEFSFKVPPQNPLYASLATGALVTILKDGVEYWRGEIKEISYDFAKVADVYCLEDLAFLNDEYLPPAAMNTESYAQRLTAALAAYNQNRTADRQFLVGYITNVQNTDLCSWVTEYDWSILDDIRACIAKDNGYVRVRRVTSGGVVSRYIDIVRLEDYGVQATQTVEYGYNILDFVKESDYENLTNVITPYGAELDSEVYEGYSARLAGTPIQNDDSITAYGRHAKAVIFDDVEDLAQLNALAAAYLTRYCQPALTMEVKAVDLSQIENVSALKVGDSIRVISKPFAVDQWLYLTSVKKDLQKIDRNTITMSGFVRTNRTLTSQAQGVANVVNNMPSKSSILEAAKRNALEILNGTEGGYVTFETNANDQITELRIANNIDYEQSTKCWRWNLGGLAYLTRSTPADPWTVTTAATMDGGFVADFITSGSLTLGNGTSFGPLLQAYSTINGQETLVTRINRNGLYAILGQIGGFDIGTLKLTRGSAEMSQYRMGCGEAGKGIVNLIGNKDSYPENMGFVQIANSGNFDTALDGIRIYGNGWVRRFDGNGNQTWARDLQNIPT